MISQSSCMEIWWENIKRARPTKAILSMWIKGQDKEQNIILIKKTISERETKRNRWQDHQKFHQESRKKRERITKTVSEKIQQDSENRKQVIH